MSDRYAEKPFLRLVDGFVLDAIGHLSREEEAALTAGEAGFARTFGERGTWREMVVARMRFPAGMAGAIREVWDKGRPRFVAANGHDPDPVQFARSFIDTNFAH